MQYTLYGRSSRRNETQRCLVNAVTQVGGLRAVVEHVPEMRVAARTMHLRPLQKHAHIGARPDVLFREGRPEAGPAGARIKLGVGAEHRVFAANATKQTALVDLIVGSAKGSVGALL